MSVSNSPAASNFIGSVMSAASQGAAGAVIGATIASVTDPITNRVLVKRMTIPQAMQEVDITQMVKYFQTTLPTNFIKFPLFEVLNELTSRLDIPQSSKGVVAGAIFTTATLPLTNYRYCKSVQEEVSLTSPKLWKAYFPTVIRDIIYANTRNMAATYISKSFPDLSKTNGGRILAMFMSVVVACIVSSPGNELRGFLLQPVDKRRTLSDFFQFERYVRSTLIGAFVMGLSLGLATLVAPPVQRGLSHITNRNFLAFALLIAVAFKYNSKGSRENNH
jgi:hypothetical protein